MTTTSFCFEGKKAVAVKSIMQQGVESCQQVCHSALSTADNEILPSVVRPLTNAVTNGKGVSRPIYIERKQVGKYNPTTKQFVKPVTRSRHYFRKVSGYAIDSEVLDYLDRVGGKEVLIVEKDTGSSLKASVETWKCKGRAGSWGCGKQQTLSEKYMTRQGFES